ncbi:peroxisomal sarcosine oxidase [Oryzias melastigma]|uniref:Peroxisomal sarcosine oxidase n=1 Tax=Oryzias melastigma TaxID=30732 RepID=A0A3B3BR88_ORYME|nr:peroxisomal sarcosine oxidase [Oryzias melastigma]
MMSDSEFDCVVIGAGVQGSFTAYQLAKRKKKTLLLEQFVLPHSRGSSHGQTRIIRKAYEEDFYVRMMEESYKLWTQMEKEAGVKLYRQTGLLVMGPENNENYQIRKKTLLKNNVPMEQLTPENFGQHFPNVSLAKGHAAFVELTAGVLYADRTLKAVQGQFQKLGGVIRDNEKVTNIKPGSLVTVSTSNGVYRTKRLVIAAGPWTNKLLVDTGIQLPLEVVRINVCYWREKVQGSYDVKQSFPCFLQTEGEESSDHIYGLPANEYPGMVKICLHAGSNTDPDQRDQQTDRSDIETLQRFVSRRFPGLFSEPAVVESCLYTVTPDDHFVLDHHPAYRNIVIGAGFSGHGFKFGPVVGQILCDLSLGEVPSFDLSPFRIRRFQAKNKSLL